VNAKRCEAGLRRFLLLGSLLLASACSYVVIPDEVPALEEAKERTLAGATVAVLNAEPDDADFVIYASSRHGSFSGSRRKWCEALAAALSSELTKRGATVSTSAPNRLRLAIPEITGHSGWATVGFKVKAVVTGADGWTKSYEGSAAAAAGMTMGGIASRSAAFALAEIVKAMLADPEFVAKLGVRDATRPR